MYKKILFTLLMFVVIVACTPMTLSATENETSLTIEHVTGKPGTIVTVDVNVSGNPGILGATLTATWDDGLTLVDCANGEAFSELTFLAPSRYEKDCNFVWYGSTVKNIVDGTILSLDFLVSETAQSGDSYCVSISYDERDVLDQNYNQVKLDVADGSVQIGTNGTEYTILFVDADGTVLESISVASGKVPVPTVTPSKAGTAQYTYTFAGWDKDIVAATADTTYTAIYTQTVNHYKVTWMNFDGSVLATEDYEYGQMPTYKGDSPTFEGNASTGWSPAIGEVTGDVTYTAQYSINDIVWVEEDGVQVGYYYENGKVKKGAGIVQVGDYLYYVLSTGKIAAGENKTISASKTNGLVEAGTYYFLHNGVLETEDVRLSGEIRWAEENGKTVGYYYVMDEIRKDVGLVELWNEDADEECWYYVLYSGKVKRNYVADGKRVNQTVKTNKVNKYTQGAGTYSFYEDGVMYDPYATESGIVRYDATGKPYYYVDGHIRKDAGLVYVERGDLAGNYIFVTYSGTLKKGTQTVKESKCNGHTEFVGTRKFDNTTGAMVIAGQGSGTVTPKTYTVTFVDWDGSLLKKQTVESGKSAVAPENPSRDGYTFIGWDKEFGNITADTVIVAVYEMESTEPKFYGSNITASAGDENVNFTISVKNNPGILGMLLSVEFDENVFTLTNSSNGDATSALTYLDPSNLVSGSNFLWYGSETGEVTDGTVLNLVFSVKGNAPAGTYPIQISYSSADSYDAEYNPIPAMVVDGTIVVQ